MTAKRKHLLLLAPVGLALFSGMEYGVGHHSCAAVFGILAMTFLGALVLDRLVVRWHLRDSPFIGADDEGEP